MSKYKFKRKETNVQSENKIMNASASPEEKTAVFVKPAETKHSLPEEDNTVFLPFEPEEHEDKKIAKRKEKAPSQPFFFSFSAFSKNKEDSDDLFPVEEVASKVEDIFNEDDMSVDEIKENLASGKTVDISAVFSEKEPPKAAPVDEFESADTEEDTYEGIEETAIEEPAVENYYEDSVKENDFSDDEDDIYIDGVGDVDIPKPKKVKKVKEQEIREYNNPDEKEEFTEIYRKKGQAALLSLIATVISTLVLIYIETKIFPHPQWLMPGKFGIVFLMADLQFTFISAICVYKSIILGAKNLFTWQPDKNSVTFAAFAVAVIQILLHFIFNKFSKDISLYSSIFSVCAVAAAFVSYIEARREHISFRVAASSGAKNIVTPLDENSVECSKFSEYLPEYASVYRMGKTEFVSGFFKTNSQKSPYNEAYKVSIPLVLLASLLFSVLSLSLVKGTTSCDAINNFAVAFMMALPVSSLFTVALPFFITSLRLSRMKSAIIGEASIDEFANTSLVSFSDVDVFNPKGIKITSIKTYGKSRIDNTYLIAAKVFNLAGGPLKEVFNRSVISTSDEDAGDCITSVCENGICAEIDSHTIYVGNQEYIEANGFTHIDDAIDSTFVSYNGRILYIAIDGEISAKFYIKYALGKNFKALLDSFCNLGICIAVTSRDPNLDTDFVTQILKDENYPIVVVKDTNVPFGQDSMPSEAVQSGVVSASSVSNMLRTFLAADKLSRVISMNTLAKYISLIFAFTLVVVAFLADGSHEKVTPLFILLYQFIWSLPVIGTSFFG